jgi:hypothetical protein
VQEVSRAAAVIPVGAAIGKGAGILLGAGEKEAAGELAGAAGQGANASANTVNMVNPSELRLPATRSEGADPFKLADQIKTFGTSTKGMQPIEVIKGANGELSINNGVTRATRAAMTPGNKVPVQVTEQNPKLNFQNQPKVGDKLPGGQ